MSRRGGNAVNDACSTNQRIAVGLDSIETAVSVVVVQQFWQKSKDDPGNQMILIQAVVNGEQGMRQPPPVALWDGKYAKAIAVWRDEVAIE